MNYFSPSHFATGLRSVLPERTILCIYSTEIGPGLVIKGSLPRLPHLNAESNITKRHHFIDSTRKTFFIGSGPRLQ